MSGDRQIQFSDELNVQGKYNLIVQSINEVAEKTLHKAGRSRKAKNPVPWWTQEYQEAVRERNKYRNRLSRHFKKEDLDAYQKKKAYAQKVKRKPQKAYWSKYCQSLNRLTNLGKVWEMVKGVQRSNSKKFTFSNLITEDKKTYPKYATKS